VSNLHSQNVASNVAVTPARLHSFSAQSAELAPIALFVYNRPEHTRRTVESLRANELAPHSDLFVFADGAKNESAASAVEAVRKFIRTIDGFKSVTIIERERNFGLATSVITGVSQLCEKFGRVIVVEDDLLTASDFLIFMNCALERYVDEPSIFSVSGFNYSVNAPEQYPYDAFCSYRSSSWGWGTWKDRWEKVDWKVPDYNSFSRDKERKRSFNRGGEDLSRMLAFQMAGELDSWAIRWAYAHWTHDAFALLPISSRVFNIGLDGSGIHCRAARLRQEALKAGTELTIRFPLAVAIDARFTEQIYRIHHSSLLRKFARFLFLPMRNRMRRAYASFRHAQTASRAAERS